MARRGVRAGTGREWLILAVRVPQLVRDAAALRKERAALTALGANPRAAVPAGGSAPEATAPEPNVPAARLQANGDAAQAPVVIVPAAASQVVLWLEASSPQLSAGLDVQTADGRMVMQVGNLKTNLQNSFVVSLPAAQLPAGRYQLRLFSISAGSTPFKTSYFFEIKSSGLR